MQEWQALVGTARAAFHALLYPPAPTPVWTPARSISR